MTDNEQFRADTEELFNKLTDYKKRHSFMRGGKMDPKGVDILESELRLVLTILRTDEENAKQRQWDSYC
jgi:hypothetical protein